ncbi:MAG: class I SAM-dependent methyltransferase [Candidatus Pacebacteria bacterium]|nr:class I SAM-dependent methyltransferase [Candidatus Paceibacterota bacterium]
MKNNNFDYPDSFFDAVISFGVLYYLNRKDILKAVSEIRRVLKDKGLALLVLRGEKDYRFGRGVEISKNTFRLSKIDKKYNASKENKMIIHFFSQREIKELFKDFRKVDIDKQIISYNNQEIQDYDYVVTLEK